MNTRSLRVNLRGMAAALAFLMALALPAASHAQTFLGSISGTVTDQSGAVVPGATVEAVENSTNLSHKTVSSSAGDFVFPDLPVGKYTVNVSGSGFKAEKINEVTVTAGAVYALPIKMAIASAGETVEVTANAVAIDTATDIQSTTLSETAVQNIPNSGRDFTQLLAQTTGFAGDSTGGGAGVASVNGTRTNSVNWQIEGTDNNDLWWNIPAVNQGGVSAIAGVIFPVDAIENFSFVTAGSIDLGRNPGGTADLTVKSGGNALHGSGYFFDHNEAFQHSNPFSGTTTETRNLHYGFSIGGPIWKDKAFFFLGGEHQNFLIGAENKATEPSTAYQNLALNLLGFYGIGKNAVGSNILNGNGSTNGLFPSSILGLAAKPLNYTATGALTGHSFNGVIKLDDQLTEKDHISFMWFVGQGTQTAPTSSALTPYFENAPIHVENYSLVYNRVLTPSISNQLSAGVSYFNQVFGDASTAFNPIALGLNTGVTDPSLPGSPHLCISQVCESSLNSSDNGFDQTGPTAPSGRNDITGHLDENLTWTKGAHQMHFGGEFRQAQVDDFYQTGQRGQVLFDGTQGPWSSTGGSAACDALATKNAGVALPATDLVNPNTGTTDVNLLYLADELAGCYDPSFTSIILGNPKRQIFVNTFSLYGADNWQVTHNFNLNFGLRYDYEGPIHSSFADLSVFDTKVTGDLAVAGQNIDNVYQQFKGGVSPRIGFAYQPFGNDKDVIRGGFGLYYDSIYIKSTLQNGDLSNISVFGIGLNPVGSSLVANADATSAPITSGAPIYPTLAQALTPTSGSTPNISTIDYKIQPAYTEEFDLNIQHSFSSKVVGQIGYVGTKGTHLMGMFDMNAPATLTGAVPYPQFGVIDEMRGNLGSIYHSLQSTLRLQNFYGIGAQFNYTWSHALDYETGLLPYLPQDPNNEKAEYGNSDFDVRNTFTGYLDYTAPKFFGPAVLTKGWEFDAGFSFHGGTPYTVLASGDISGSVDNNDRALQVLTDPNKTSHSIVDGVVQWFKPGAFVDPAAGTFSPTRRGQNYNPGYESFDLSVIKNTKITERVNTQFKADIFNLFDHTNFGPVGLPTSGEGGQIGETIGVFLGNPGFGPGEPLNVEFGMKVIF